MPFRLWFLPAALVVSCGLYTTAQAHPHVWVSVQSELVMDGQKITAINHRWTFDEAFSAFASQGLDENDDGVLSREELQPLAQVNVESLSEYGYFSELYQKGAPDTGETAFGDPYDYWLSVSGDQLVLHFTLPVVADVDTHQEAVLDVYDPSFFVDFTFADKSPAKLLNAPANCHARVERPKGLDDDVASQLAAIPADQRAIPSDLMQFTVAMANQVYLKCD
ncbi:ABC-type uncharacterized transport system, substrate-binding protein [Cohaesibacter marisflavi]|uniref:ABC-type uncharacterized transport system, substrate-binding protein n=1 Tax=Cohaesibacter marisflavi TaxID=655353 RepID=A0A1I5HMH2_9HYPH|nr:DUF1007 family protein [Cohaesibacter marisflavi]SFO49518.1 ABC-type uncharacterized transport system, substrate-binding protein [Cohaesibacter marisflavi]